MGSELNCWKLETISCRICSFSYSSSLFVKFPHFKIQNWLLLATLPLHVVVILNWKISMEDGKTLSKQYLAVEWPEGYEQKHKIQVKKALTLQTANCNYNNCLILNYFFCASDFFVLNVASWRFFFSFNNFNLKSLFRKFSVQDFVIEFFVNVGFLISQLEHTETLTLPSTSRTHMHTFISLNIHTHMHKHTPHILSFFTYPRSFFF